MQKQIPEHCNINGIFPEKTPSMMDLALQNYTIFQNPSLMLQRIVGEVNKKSNFSFS